MNESDVVTVKKSTLYSCGCFVLAFVAFLILVIIGYGVWYMMWGGGVGMFRLA